MANKKVMGLIKSSSAGCERGLLAWASFFFFFGFLQGVIRPSFLKKKQDRKVNNFAFKANQT
jgi:hypothetical protein